MSGPRLLPATLPILSSSAAACPRCGALSALVEISGRAFPMFCIGCAEVAERESLELDAERLARLRASALAERIRGAAIPAEFRAVPDEWIPARQWSALDGGRPILFAGPVGIGKTASACRLLVEWISRNGAAGLYLPAKRFILAIQSTYGAAATETTEAAVNRLARVGCLVLDDLGKERPTEDSMSWLELVVDERWANSRKLIVTTNLSMVELARVYGERIADRLAAGSVFVLSGRSYRGGER